MFKNLGFFSDNKETRKILCNQIRYPGYIGIIIVSLIQMLTAMIRLLILYILSSSLLLACHAQNTTKIAPSPVITAAERTELYFPLIRHKNIAIFANHTSIINDVNIVDSLHKAGFSIKVVFGPEHGFRGTADAGAKVGNETDPKTGISVVSLYGSKRRPSSQDLKGIDLMLFDIQDVGTRFYTYISSLEEYMIAAIENDIPLIVLDRPNPNGFYVAGPILDTAFRSFVGMQPVPVVYGMTIGEYAQYLLGEHLQKKTKKGAKFNLTVIPLKNWDHNSVYELPVKPSPNLPDMASVYRYASTCFFEGTVLSEGRGTEKPFQYFGHPSLPKNLFSFTPRSMPGAAKPKLLNQLSYGWDVSGDPTAIRASINNTLQIEYLLEAYRLFPQKDSFFLKKFFYNLSGSEQLYQQIVNGLSAAEIRLSWEPGITAFKKVRKKYLLYKDFE
jgi:uncharacterized protein YbbC (DUF1343 family)